MTSPAVIVLGPMAAGKTSVGRELASLLEVEFLDLDARIVETTGQSIPELFAQRGEEGFRVVEAEVLAEVLASHGGVLALGGGAAMTPGSRKLLRGGPIVLLEISEHIAARRLQRGAGRPMLAGDDPLARWRELTGQRMPVYRDLARWRVDSGHGSPAAVARRVTALLTRDLLPDPEKETP